MKRPISSQRSDRMGAPMTRGMTINDDFDEDVTEANPVVEAAPRKLAQRFEDRAPVSEPEIDYGDYGQQLDSPGLKNVQRERGGRLNDYNGNDDDDEAPLPPPRRTVPEMDETVDPAPKPRRRPEDGATMAEIQARIAAKRAERNKRDGMGDEGPKRMVREEFALKPDTAKAAAQAPRPLVDPNMPSATLKQIPEYNVFPGNARGDVPAGWTRQTLPSLGIPYDFSDVFVRPLEVPELLGIHASVENGSYTMFLDALNNAVNVDIRDLTASDLRFLMYWWRISSFTRSPYTLTWTSRYGNLNKTMITQETDLEVIDLQMSPDEYQSYREQGIDFPRVRDAEYLGDITLSKTDRWAAERAQYIVTNEDGDRWYPSRLEKLKEGGIVMFELVRDFSKGIEHGMVERLTVTDSQYNPVSAVVALRQQAAYLARAVTSRIATPDMIVNTNERVDDFLDEADQIERTLTNIDLIESGEIPEGMTAEDLPFLKASLKPKEEAIALKISALDFFPEI